MNQNSPVEYNEGVACNVEEYPDGLNANFLGKDASELYEVFGNDGKGLFEDCEQRDIANNVGSIMQILKEHGLHEGSTICDVGAGTGLFVREMCTIVSHPGKVVACEISPGFVALLKDKFQDKVRIGDLEIVQSQDKSLCLLNKQFDMVFVCDVYHHFEYPKSMLRDISLVLKPYGVLVVIDFHRDSSKIWSKPKGWVESHVRLGQAEVREEIANEGFKFLEEPTVSTLRENYIMMFEKL